MPEKPLNMPSCTGIGEKLLFCLGFFAALANSGIPAPAAAEAGFVDPRVDPRAKGLQVSPSHLGAPGYLRPAVLAPADNGIHFAGAGPALDYNSDGLRDVVSLDAFRESSEDDDFDTKITVLSGRDGRVLWRLRRSAGITFPIPARVGTDGKRGMLIVQRRASSSVTVTALDSEGEPVWERELTSENGFDEPRFLAASNALPGKATDIFLAEITWELVAGTIRGAFIDGRDGSVLRQTLPQATFSIPWARPVSDLTGDGLDDFVVAGADVEDRPWLKAFRGVDGNEIWTTNEMVTGFSSLLGNDADFTGDGTNDLLIRAADEPGSSLIAMFDGASGGKLWTTIADHAFAVGNADRKGGEELLVYEAGPRNDNKRFTLSFGVYDFRGQPRFERTWSLPMRGETRTTLGGIMDMGDLDVDGVRDLRVELATGKGDHRRKRVAVLSGRSAKLLFRDEHLWPLQGSVDGHGDDLFRVPTEAHTIRVPFRAVDGKTRALQWKTSLRGKQSWIVPVPLSLNRDRHDDLLLHILSPRFKDGKLSGAKLLVGAVDGRNGRLRWTAPILKGGTDLLVALVVPT